MHGKMQNLFSWLNQVNEQECEVIIIHDKQDQKTSEELQQKLQKLESLKVRLLEGVFGSPGMTRNFGKQLATGTHIMFCDSDDVLELSTVISVIKKYPMPSVIIGGYETVHSLPNQLIVKHRAPGNLLQLAKSPGMWRFIFKSEVISDLDFSEYCMGEDQLFLAQAAVFSQNILRVSETLYHYHASIPGQLTSQKERIPDLISVVRVLKELELNFFGKNKTFVKLLILKNCLTILKNFPYLKIALKKDVSASLVREFIKEILTLNWNQTFRFGGKSE
jgi:hypothetical protein